MKPYVPEFHDKLTGKSPKVYAAVKTKFAAAIAFILVVCLIAAFTL